MSHLLSPPPIETPNGILSPGLTTLPPTPATEAYSDPDTKWIETSPTEELREQIFGEIEEERLQREDTDKVASDELALLEEERAEKREASSAVSGPSGLLRPSDNSSVKAIITPTLSETFPGTMDDVHPSSVPPSSGFVDEGYFSDDDEEELDPAVKEDIEQQRHEFLEAQIEAFDAEKRKKLQEKLDNGGLFSPEEERDAYDLGLSLPDDDSSPPSSRTLSDNPDYSSVRVSSYDLRDDDDDEDYLDDEDLLSDGEQPDSVATSPAASPIPSPPESPEMSPATSASPSPAVKPLTPSAGDRVAEAIFGPGQTFEDLKSRSLDEMQDATIARLAARPEALASAEFREAANDLREEVEKSVTVSEHDRELAAMSQAASDLAQDSQGHLILVVASEDVWYASG